MDIGQVPLNDKPEQVKGQGVPTQLKGEKSEQGEDVAYVEVRGPSKPGDRAKVPYLQVLPKYKKSAEEALKRTSIPKNRENRVRDYFDSITKGKQ